MKRFFATSLVIALLFVAAPIQYTSAAFFDVPTSHTNYEAITWVRDQGIVNGYADSTYRPDQKINRAEFTKIIMLASIFKNQSATCDDNLFPDVPADAWFAEYVCLAHENAVIKGYPDGTFRPEQNISFVEAAKIISIGFGKNFAANDIWYKPFVQELGNQRSIPITITKLDYEISRGEMAEIIYRMINSVQNKPSHTYESLTGDIETQPERTIPEEPEEPTPEEPEEEEPEETNEEDVEEIIKNDIQGAIVRGNHSRIGQYLSSAKPEGERKWHFLSDDVIITTPAYSDSRIFVGTNAGEVIALDDVLGDIIWKTTISSNKRDIIAPTTISVSQNEVYIGNSSGTLFALAADTGAILWEYKTNKPITSAPSVLDGIVYFGSGNGQFYALDQRDGTLLWNFKTEILEQLSVSLNSLSLASFDTDRVYFSDSEGVYALRMSTGEKVWKKTTKQNALTPIVHDGVVYFGSLNGFVYAVNAKSGEVFWERKIREVPTTALAYKNGMLYFGTELGKLHAINAKTGALNWNFDTTSRIDVDPIIVGDTLYFYSREGFVYGLNIETGELVWKYKISNVENSPIIINGIMYLSATDRVIAVE